MIVCFFITQDNWKDSIEKKNYLLLEKVSSIEKKVLDQRRDGEAHGISTPAPSKKRVMYEYNVVNLMSKLSDLKSV